MKPSHIQYSKKWLEFLLQEKQERIDKAIEQLEQLKNLYDDNYTITDKAKDIIEILKGSDKE